MTHAPSSPRISFTLQIAAGAALGMAAGALWGTSTGPLGELGKLLIQLIKTVATPLLFLSIVQAVVKTDLDAKAGAKMLFIASFNASLALGLGLLLSNWLQPGLLMPHGLRSQVPTGQEVFSSERIDFLAALASHIPSNLVSPFLNNSILSVVLLALLLGFALRQVREDEGFSFLTAGLGTLLKATEVILGWVIRFIPFAVFGVMANTVGKYGLEPLRGLAAYVGVALLGLGLHIALVYSGWIRWVGRLSLRAFWKEAKTPAIYAWGVNSSLATLPITLRALDHLGVSKKASALGACVGTNLNNDGILLYEGMAVLFVAQASGLHLSLGQQAAAAAVALVAAMGVAGVPEAGMVSLALVLNTVGLPLELLPLLLTVDWIVARARSVTNVLSDMVLSLGIDRLRWPWRGTARLI